MTVYVLRSEGCEYPAYELSGVFSTEAKAKEAEKSLYVDCIITEMELELDVSRLLAAAKGLIAAHERCQDSDDDGPFFTALDKLETAIAEHEAAGPAKEGGEA